MRERAGAEPVWETGGGSRPERTRRGARWGIEGPGGSFHAVQPVSAVLQSLSSWAPFLRPSKGFPCAGDVPSHQTVSTALRVGIPRQRCVCQRPGQQPERGISQGAEQPGAWGRPRDGEEALQVGRTAETSPCPLGERVPEKGQVFVLLLASVLVSLAHHRLLAWTWGP